MIGDKRYAEALELRREHCSRKPSRAALEGD